MPYLDANATQPLRPRSENAVLAALRLTGNPSSVHQSGRSARRLLESARDTIAACFGAEAAQLVFTSGGTEADVAAIRGLGRGRRLIVSAIEHDAVRASAPEALSLPVDGHGRANLDQLAGLLADGRPSLVCLMLANNETGVLQPVRAAAALCRRHGALLHVDAVQAAGRMPVRLDELQAHSMAISSHKLGGPVGAGAWLLSPDAPACDALLPGGGQERGRRGGTPPLAIIGGFAEAAVASRDDDIEMIADLRDQAEAAAERAGAVVCGDRVQRLKNTACLALPGVAALTQVMTLDLVGIAVSAGAACSSGKVQASHVLQAMGLGELAGQAIRISLPWNVTAADIGAFITAYERMAARLRPTLVAGGIAN